MRCPQCGGITPATTQTHGVASAYCEDCAQWWEWVPRPQRIGRSDRQGRIGRRWVARVAAGSFVDGARAAGDRSDGRTLLWRGRLLRETETPEPQPVEVGG